MVGSKRVYAPRSASKPAVKRRAVSVKRQLMRLKDTKRSVTLQTASPTGANGNYTQLISDWNNVSDGLEADLGQLIAMNVAVTVSHAGSGTAEFARVLILKGKRDDTITSGTPLWLDAAQSNGQAGTSTEVLGLEQMLYPINRDGFVVKYDRVFALDDTAGNAVMADKAHIKCNEKIQIYDDTGAHSANYYICSYSIRADGSTAGASTISTAVELLYKDQV